MAKWATDAPTKLNYHAISTRTQWPCRKSKKQFKRSQRRDERRKRSTLRVQRTAPRCCDFGQWYGLPFVLTLWAYCQWGLVRLQWSRESWERDQARPHIAIITRLIGLHASLPSFSLNTSNNEVLCSHIRVQNFLGCNLVCSLDGFLNDSLPCIPRRMFWKGPSKRIENPSIYSRRMPAMHI